jgi:hypothetical protein
VGGWRGAQAPIGKGGSTNRGLIRLATADECSLYGLDPAAPALIRQAYRGKADLNTPMPPSRTDAEREAELTRVNGRLYTIAKAQLDKSCPLIAGTSPSSVVR